MKAPGSLLRDTTVRLAKWLLLLMRTTVRPADPDDFPRIAAHYGVGDTPWDPFGDVEKLKRIPIEGLSVAEVEGEYAGFACHFEAQEPWFDASVERYAQIEEVQVLPRFRGLGVGKALLHKVLARLKDLSLDAIYIETTEENAIARHLYEGVGFKLLHRSLFLKYRGSRRSRKEARGISGT